jgi:pyruvate formate lyase activating enzyme
LKTVAVTAGYITPEARRDFYAHMDAANVDLKAFTQQFYHKLCFANLAPVLDTLRWLKQETAVWIEVTTLLIPGHNDGPAEVAALCDWVMTALGPDIPVHFSAFHPDWKMMDVPATPPETLFRARRIALEVGIRHAYVGNVHDRGRDSTYCHACGTRVVERDWYQLGEWRLDGAGRCLVCGTRCAGVFEGRPGDWGRRRQPVRLAEYRT